MSRLYIKLFTKIKEFSLEGFWKYGFFQKSGNLIRKQADSLQKCQELVC